MIEKLSKCVTRETRSERIMTNCKASTFNCKLFNPVVSEQSGVTKVQLPPSFLEHILPFTDTTDPDDSLTSTLLSEEFPFPSCLPLPFDTKTFNMFYDFHVGMILPPKPQTIVDLLDDRMSWENIHAFFGIDYPYPYEPKDISFMECLSTSCATYTKEVLGDIRLRRFELPARRDRNIAPYHGLVRMCKSSLEVMRQDLSYQVGGFLYPRKREKDGNKWRLLTLEEWHYRPPKFEHLIKNLSILSNLFGKNIPWFTEQSHSGIIVAGGFLTISLFDMTLQAVKCSDIDVFVVAQSEEQANEIVWKLTDSMMQNLDIVTTYSDKPNVININIFQKEHIDRVNEVIESHNEAEDDVPVIKVQIIKRIFATPAHVVHGFDLSACKVLYDGDQVYATESAVRTFNTGTMLYDETKMSTSGVFRYGKYLERFGLRAFIPGIPDGLADSIGIDPEHCRNKYGVASLKKEILEYNETMSIRASDYDPYIAYNNVKFRRMKPIEKVNGWNLVEFTGSMNPVVCNIYADLIM